MILVDSSVWIDFLSSPVSVHQPYVSELLRLPHAVGIPGPVVQEVLQGIRDEAAFQRVKTSLERFPVVHADTPVYVAAAAIYRALAAKGATIPPGDVTIAAITIASDHELYTLDRHFKRIARHSALRLHHPA